ncbi:hypothetical protein [Mucilaginibacter gotjawali]|uniref:Uncharacterized protein n=2 Tax=Mucilaginibacter gotjawali TaxID=1550579 RepID=A0A0X8X4B5_9SPHI|nr:hypothetical protein [Mucilaginibacter gotjawali]MBB3057433.1 hypothetical protein [Mucilaginibacter gotjawali]BAU55447.1 hypothetical protein MgSA37_03636 [Mucilaginibacter gotjawali]
MKTLSTVLILSFILFSCKKGSNPQVTLNGTLTTCPTNSTCTYNYYNNADFKDWSKPVSGNSRVFWYKSVNNTICDAATEIYFKTALSNNDFDITSNQIAAGQVSGYVFSCACCDVLANVKPIGGEIKGKRTDATHWLINASVIIGTASNAPLDTIIVNQYFVQQQLP